MKKFLKIIAPGLLVAATGVGAGDLAGGAFAGSKLGMAVLWAVLLGAFFKFVITEGLTRWQLATGTTLIEGAVEKFGNPVKGIFLFYLIIWSFAVGSALISACGVALYALVPIFPSAETGKIVFGILQSIIAFTIVWFGSFRSFEKIMGAAVGLMFIAVIVTAAMIGPDIIEVLKGIFIPIIPEYINPQGSEQGIEWTLALIGGVGGTLTILSYGYWIKETGRHGKEDLKISRIDIGAGYLVTAVFGMAMVIIASQIDIDKQSSARLVIVLAEKLESQIGAAGAIVFLVGAWAAVFSSILGVWQSVPYLFDDFMQIISAGKYAKKEVNTKSKNYRRFLIYIAFAPMLGLVYKFVYIQKIYAVLGAFVVPLIAILLFFLNGNKKWVGEEFVNSRLTQFILAVVIIFFVVTGIISLVN